jgi:lysophospholipase L1-like esterase
MKSSRRFPLLPWTLVLCVLGLCRVSSAIRAAELEPKPADPYFAAFAPARVPSGMTVALKRGDRLAICGDSITEQRMYSRIMETYLAACMPQLGVSVRQFGWSGETAPGFLARMTNDCLRFNPTVATTCYGMNDHGYRPYEPSIGERYQHASASIVRAFKSRGARVVQGSPGCVGKNPPWTKFPAATVQELNVNLCALRNLGLDLARTEAAGFADVFWPMLKADFSARQAHGTQFAVPGKDGVHPDWAGQLIMAHAFLKALGLGGELGRFTIDLTSGRAKATAGHRILGARDGVVRIRSVRYPFCAPSADPAKDGSIRAGMALVPFNQELNRMTLHLSGATGASYDVTWGDATRTYTGAELAQGVNLAADFPSNPFDQAFARLDAAVAAKQAYETRQIKQLFHGDEGQLDPDGTAAFTERIRARLAARIRQAQVPVTHTIAVRAR